MAESDIIQMHDYAGNNQYPVTLASLVYDEDGETVSKKLALLLDWFEWGDDEQTSVKTKYHFWSEKQLGAGGIGEEGEGGEGGIGTITGIKVNGEVWNEPDEFGVLTIPDYPTSLEWANINGRPTHLSQFTDDVVAGHYLPLTGGTIEGRFTVQTEDMDGVTIYRTNTKYSMIHFYNNSGSGRADVGYIGVIENGQPVYLNSGGSEYPLLHSGNVGEYTAGDSDKLGGEVADRYMVSIGSNGQDVNEMPYEVNRPFILRVGASNPNLPSSLVRYGNLVHFGSYQADTAFELFGGQNSDVLLFRRGDLTTIYQNPWKTIAFTDSTVAGADALKDDAGNSIVYYRENDLLYIGDVIYANASTKILGKNIYLAYGVSANIGLILNSYGNVTIGGSDLAGTDAKLYVDGIAYATYGLSASSVSINRNPSTGGILNTSLSALKIEAYTNDVRVNVYKPTAADYTTLTLFNNGCLGIGTTSYNGYLLDVAGTGRFTGNLIVGGQVGIGTSSPDEMLHVAGNIRLKNASAYGCFLKFGDSNYCYLHEDSDDHLKIYADKGILLSTDVNYGVTIDRTLTIGSAVLSWDSVNNALKIEGNVYTTGQLSAGGVGTEVQKVFDIAAATSTTEANASYTKTLTHNLNTYDLAVVVYEVEEITQSGVTTEKLTQVLADVTLTDENNVTVYFATRKINRKYRIVIIG